MSEPFDAEKRVVALEKALEEQTADVDKLWETINILIKRVDQLRTAVPHVQFKDW